jgi:Flp pilus assembly protein TadG
MGEGTLMRGRSALPRPAEGSPRHLSRPGRLARAFRRCRRDERGTALVEFALVSLPLFLVVFGIIDFGRAMNYYNDLTQLAGQGARAAAVNQDPNGGAADTNFQHQLACASTPGELQGGITVQVTKMPVNVGDPVTVKTSYNFTFIPVLKLATLTLSASQTERYEVPQQPSYNPSNDVGPGVGACP